MDRSSPLGRSTASASRAWPAASTAPTAGATSPNPAPRPAALPGRAASSAASASTPPRAATPGASAGPIHVDEAEREEAQLQASLTQDAALRGRLTMLGLTILRNAGGEDANLCLLNALLQAAGRPLADVERHAQELRHDPGLALANGPALHTDPQAFEALAQVIFSPGPVPPVLVMKAGPAGRPQFSNPLWARGRNPPDPATVPHDTVVILESPGRFELVANASGRPWWRALSRLGNARHDQGDRLALIEAVTPDWAEHQRRLSLPRDREIESLLPGGAASVIDEARALAEANRLVDGVWVGLQRLRTLEIESNALPNGRQVRHLAVTFPLPGQTEPERRVVSLTSDGGRVVALSIKGEAGDDVHVNYAAGRPHMRQALPDRWPRTLLPALQAHAVQPGESKVQHVRRLARAVPWSDDASLARASGLSLRTVQRDPFIHRPILSTGQQQRLTTALERVPRHPREANMAYARRLKAFDPALGEQALVRASNVTLKKFREQDFAISPAVGSKRKRSAEE